MLHPDERPVVWKRTDGAYDRQRVGFEVEVFDQMPTVKGVHQRRRHFNTTAKGKSAAGHRFPDLLNEDEKVAVLEYLKTI